jgi:ferredoxin-NADP reductase
MAITTTVILGVKSDMTQINSTWFAAVVTDIIQETPSVKTFRFALPHPVSHLAGQHYEIRLTAPNGYQAARLYSAASAAPGNGGNDLELTVALLIGGEVSPYLHGSVKVGDQLDLRGPLGKFFVWEPSSSEPALLIGGGSGIVPMRAILQSHTQSKSAAPLTILYSARSYDEIIYKTDFLKNRQVQITLTDDVPSDWHGRTGLIDSNMLQDILEAFATVPVCYVCGVTPFVEAMANNLITLGVPAARIKAERFGASAA